MEFYNKFFFSIVSPSFSWQKCSYKQQQNSVTNILGFSKATRCCCLTKNGFGDSTNSNINGSVCLIQ